MSELDQKINPSAAQRVGCGFCRIDEIMAMTFIGQKRRPETLGVPYVDVAAGIHRVITINDTGRTLLTRTGIA